MDYAVIFADNEEKSGKRAEFMKEHIAFLRAHDGLISAAGPMKDAQTGSPAGGLWLVSAASAEEVVALVKADPFWPTGLRKSYQILEWKKVHAVAARPPPQASLDRSSGSDGPSQIT
ncbi:MAG: YciI family protein [Parvibaculaceae bacterium]